VTSQIVPHNPIGCHAEKKKTPVLDATEARQLLDRHEMPCHHTLEAYLHAYGDGAGIADEPKGPLDLLEWVTNQASPGRRLGVVFIGSLALGGPLTGRGGVHR